MQQFTTLGHLRCSWAATPRNPGQHRWWGRLLGIAVQEHLGYARLSSTALEAGTSPETGLRNLLNPKQEPHSVSHVGTLQRFWTSTPPLQSSQLARPDGADEDARAAMLMDHHSCFTPITAGRDSLPSLILHLQLQSPYRKYPSPSRHMVGSSKPVHGCLKNLTHPQL